VIRATLAAGGGGLLWGVRDLAIVNAKRAGLTVNPENTVHAGPFCGMFEIINLYFFNCVGAGLEIADAYMGRISDIWSRQNGMGFYFRGGFTSLTVERCFAKENTNQGFSIDGAVYSVFSGCGSDENKWGYVLQNLNGVTFTGCGTELNELDGWLIRTANVISNGVPVAVQDIRSVVIQGGFNWRNGTAAAGHSTFSLQARDNRGMRIAIKNSSSLPNYANDYAIVADGAGGLIELETGLNSFTDHTNKVFKNGTVSTQSTDEATADTLGTVRKSKGSWLPSVGGTTTYFGRSGRYQVIDKTCWFEGYVKVNVVGGAFTPAEISGLPFTAANTQELGTVIVGYFTNLSGAFVNLTGTVNGGSKIIGLRGLVSAGTSMGVANCIGNGTVIYFSGHYPV